jgi:dTDP-glucose 4,6-dehydratase
LHFLVGDVRTFDFPEEKFTHVIHMATESSTFVDAREPLPRLEAIIDGMRRVLEFTVQCGAHSFLLTSTGGVYGKQPPEVDRVSEDFTGGPSPTAPSPFSAMGEGKRVCELLACLHAQRFGFAAKIARCFAFSGPHLPIDGHYAIGNFIRDVLEGRPVRVKGDGTPVRSYFYAVDLTAWLWTILLDGPTNEAFNVGSEDAISIADLARRVAAQVPDSLPVVIEQNAIPGRPPERYVPSTEKARRVLGLQQTISLDEGVQRMLTWHRKRLDLAP